MQVTVCHPAFSASSGRLRISTLKSLHKLEVVFHFLCRAPTQMVNINSPFIVRRFWIEIKWVHPHYLLNIADYISVISGPGSSVGVETDYGLDGPWIESRRGGRGGARFSVRPDRSWGPPSLLYSGYRVFPGGKLRPGRTADHSPPSSAEVLEE